MRSCTFFLRIVRDRPTPHLTCPTERGDGPPTAPQGTEVSRVSAQSIDVIRLFIPIKESTGKVALNHEIWSQ